MNGNLNNISCQPDVIFSANSSYDELYPVDYLWTFGDGNSSTSTSDIHTYAGSGSFNVDVTISTSNGCQQSFSKVIEKSPLAEVFVPNAFTPNGDKKNDILFVRGDINELSFKIYNRWGELVFKSHNQSIGWDGTYNSEPVDPGVFIYHLTTRCGDTEILSKGNVTVIR